MEFENDSDRLIAVLFCAFVALVFIIAIAVTAAAYGTPIQTPPPPNATYIFAQPTKTGLHNDHFLFKNYEPVSRDNPDGSI